MSSPVRGLRSPVLSHGSPCHAGTATASCSNRGCKGCSALVSIPSFCVTGDGRGYDVRPDVTLTFDLDACAWVTGGVDRNRRGCSRNTNRPTNIRSSATMSKAARRSALQRRVPQVCRGIDGQTGRGPTRQASTRRRAHRGSGRLTSPWRERYPGCVGNNVGPVGAAGPRRSCRGIPAVRGRARSLARL